MSNPAWKKGVAQNPNGRPKGSKNFALSLLKVANRLQYKHKVHPVDQLVEIAIMAKLNKEYELASEIWLKLLQYLEPTKKPVESAPEKPTTPAESVKNAEELLKELEEMANAGQSTASTIEPTSNPVSMATGETSIQTKTDSEKDLQ